MQHSKQCLKSYLADFVCLILLIIPLKPNEHYENKFTKTLRTTNILYIQQGLEIRGFWGLEKTVQRKTVLREVYNYVLNEIFFQKTVYLQGFC